jgi:release factor glutamine methyltransferase
LLLYFAPGSPMRLIELLWEATRDLQDAGVVDPELDARLLLESSLGKTRTEIYLESDSLVSDEAQEKFRQFIRRRIKREPVAYILGEQEFWSLAFHVSQDVLIPRPETEYLIEKVLHLTDSVNYEKGLILDLCCGSGVIAAILAKETRQQIIAADISFAALEVARKNIIHHELGDLVLPVQSDLFSAFKNQKLFSLIVSNPPYVSSFDIDNSLEPEVACYEPRLALDGGGKGLQIIIEMLKVLPNVLLPGGQLFMEIGADQGEAVQQLLKEMSDRSGIEFLLIEILMDYAGRDRILHVRLAD